MNKTKKILAVLSGIVSGISFFFAGRVIGQWYIGVLKNTEGMVTASDIVGLRYILPVFLAILAGYIAYSLLNVDE